MKLKKSLYGFRQRPKSWIGTMNLDLAAIGFRPFKAVPCVYTCKDETSFIILIELAVMGFRPLKADLCVYIYKDEIGFIILMLYVDDIVFLSTSKTLLNKLKKQLVDRFEISDTSDVSRIIGIIVTRDREKGAIAIS